MRKQKNEDNSLSMRKVEETTENNENNSMSTINGNIKKTDVENIGDTIFSNIATVKKGKGYIRNKPDL